jgi:hypothetical protein
MIAIELTPSLENVTVADAKTCTQSFAMVYVLKRPFHRSYAQRRLYSGSAFLISL